MRSTLNSIGPAPSRNLHYALFTWSSLRAENIVLLFVVVALFVVNTTVVLQKALGRAFVMVQLCHSNDFGSL
jgi:hypothetical protein